MAQAWRRRYRRCPIPRPRPWRIGSAALNESVSGARTVHDGSSGVVGSQAASTQPCWAPPPPARVEFVNLGRPGKNLVLGRSVCRQRLVAVAQARPLKRAPPWITATAVSCSRLPRGHGSGPGELLPTSSSCKAFTLPLALPPSPAPSVPYRPTPVRPVPAMGWGDAGHGGGLRGGDGMPSRGVGVEGV